MLSYAIHKVEYPLWRSPSSGGRWSRRQPHLADVAPLPYVAVGGGRLRQGEGAVDQRAQLALLEEAEELLHGGAGGAGGGLFPPGEGGGREGLGHGGAGGHAV